MREREGERRQQTHTLLNPGILGQHTSQAVQQHYPHHSRGDHTPLFTSNILVFSFFLFSNSLITSGRERARANGHMTQHSLSQHCITI